MAKLSGFTWEYTLDMEGNDDNFFFIGDSVPVFNPDGTKMMWMRDGSALPNITLQTAIVDTPWELSSAHRLPFMNSGVVDDEDSFVGGGLETSDDGLHYFWGTINLDGLIRYTTTEAYNTKFLGAASSSQMDTLNALVGIQHADMGVRFLEGGSKLWIGDLITDKIYELGVGTAYDLTTLTYSGVSLSVNGDPSGNTGGTPIGFDVNEDGTVLYVAVSSGASKYTVVEYDIPISYSLASTELSGNTLIVDDIPDAAAGGSLFQPVFPTGLRFSKDGTKFYLAASIGGQQALIQFGTEDEGLKLVLGGKFFGIFLGTGNDDGNGACQYSLENTVGDIGIISTEVFSQGGEVRKLVTELTDLWCVEGDTPKLFFDGNLEPSQTVVNGKITVADGRKIARAAVGLPYTCDIELLDVEAGTSPDTLQGELKKITDVTVRLFKSRMPMVGPTSDQLTQMRTRRTEKFGEASGLLSGDAVVNLPPDWNSNGRIFFRQCDPVPLTILAVFPHTIIEDDEE